MIKQLDMTNTSNEISRSDSTPTAATIPPSLIRQCLTLHHRNHRCSNEAVEMASEFMRLLIIEARRRAAIEVRKLLLDTCFSFRKKPTLLIQSMHHRQSAKQWPTLIQHKPRPTMQWTKTVVTMEERV